MGMIVCNVYSYVGLYTSIRVLLDFSFQSLVSNKSEGYLYEEKIGNKCNKIDSVALWK